MKRIELVADYAALEHSITAPKGFRASGVHAGIKEGSTKRDCALLVSDLPAVAAGTFTTNLFKSPPAQWTEQVCGRGKARGVFVNSGNANACTGQQGAADAQATAEFLAQGLGVAPGEIGVLSTGVIGVPLPMDRIKQGAAECIEALSREGGGHAAAAIMTTDTVAKETAFEMSLGEGSVRLGAIAKGSGMICPNMATMICLITTDAAIEPGPLRVLLRDAVKVSFNQMCIDNDMSTSDAVVCLANGQADVPLLTPGNDDFAAFGTALTELCVITAQKLVLDGEGATKFVEIQVSGAATDNDAGTIARSIAVSQLCKTAFFGQDPNWGRIACAAGYAGIGFDPDRLCLWIDEVQLVCNGMPAVYREEEAAACMHKPEFCIRLEVGDGPGSTVFWTSDLSYKYVEINADYRT